MAINNSTLKSPSQPFTVSPSHEHSPVLDAPVDPRVHIELDRLNAATFTINRLETNLGEARAAFRHLLCESSQRIEEIRLKLGACIEKSRPYYEARFKANDSLRRSQLAAMRYERANSAHSAAREMVYLAEQGLNGRTLDPAWQEMLNHATQRVNDAEKERIISEAEHKFAYIKHETTNTKVKQMQKDLKRAITKSRPYYEMKAQFNHMLELQRNKVNNFEHQVQTSKLTYADALRNLEQISDEIHRSRNLHKNLQSNAPRQTSTDSTGSSYVDDFCDEFQAFSSKLNPSLTDTVLDPHNFESLSYDKNMSSASQKYDDDAKLKCNSNSFCNEWTEINLDAMSPEGEHSGNECATTKCVSEDTGTKPKLIRQKTLPNPRIENEYSSVRSKIKFEHGISNWISRSSVVKEDLDVDGSMSTSRRPSLDNILGSTNEKMKEIFSHGMMMLNISSLSERKSDGKSTIVHEDKNKSFVKFPKPLETSLSYKSVDDDISDSESCSSTDMLNEDQISSLMLDKNLSIVCEQVLGTPLEEVIYTQKELKLSSQND